MDSVDNDGSIIVEGDDRNFLFTFETDGSLTAEQTLGKAAEILSKKASAMSEEIAQLE
jgi:DNA-directed RNA polymerase subunit D